MDGLRAIRKRCPVGFYYIPVTSADGGNCVSVTCVFMCVYVYVYMYV